MIKKYIEIFKFPFKTVTGIVCFITVIVTAILVSVTLIHEFPILGIILAAVILFVVIDKIVVEVKFRKREKFLKETEENRQKRLNEETEKYR